MEVRASRMAEAVPPASADVRPFSEAGTIADYEFQRT
jgi:hypothetical protein